MNRRAPIAVLGGLFLSACLVGPNYHQPVVPTPAAFSEPVTGARTALSPDAADLSRWWTKFHDPVLQSLIERALDGNLDLGAAASRVRQARYQVTVARAAFWPTVNATGSAVTINSDRSSAAAAGGVAGTSASQGFELPGHLNLYSTGFDATWELDLFGGVRRSVEEAKANDEASIWAHRDGEVSLTAEVAADYFALREAQTRIAVGQDELARQQSLGALIGDRRKVGLVTNLDVNQQTGVIAAASAQLRQLEAEARTQIHALAVLVGENPETLEPQLERAGGVPPPPPSLPVGLPADLLTRRPDIRKAERQLAAANAAIGVQTANLYPKLDLIGLASFASPTLSQLFSTQSFTSGALGLATEPIFNAGKTRAQIASAREAARQADLAYRSTILGALRDVEDALARFRFEELRRAQLVAAVKAADGSLAIARDQYSVGLVTYVNVYVAENASLNARDQLAQCEAQSAMDLVSLYKALGGGWAA